MKNSSLIFVCLFGLGLDSAGAASLGTAFTYQGQLTDGGAPANGQYDLRFALYDDVGGPTMVSGPLTNSPVGVTGGWFTVMLDFGPGVFTSEARWLEIAVRTNQALGDFTVLTPRQLLTPVPQALWAAQAQTASNATTAASANALAGTLPDSQLSPNVARLSSNSVFSGEVTFIPAGGKPPFVVANTNVVSLLNADLLDGKHSGAFWQLQGNAGTAGGTNFIGTTDNQPLELKVNQARALRLEPQSGAPNLIGGASNNTVAGGVAGVTIGGGASNKVAAGSPYATVGGGANQNIGTNAAFATVMGGGDNRVLAGAKYAMVAGGRSNLVGAPYTFAAGLNARADDPGAFVWADAAGTEFASEQTNQFRVRALGGVQFVTGLNLTNAPASDVRLSTTGGVSVASLSPTNAALDVRSGYLRVRNANTATNTPVFIHRTSNANNVEDASIIDHPLCNNDPHAILLVTPVMNPNDPTGTNYFRELYVDPVGVYYVGDRADFPAWARRKWAIYNRTGTLMSIYHSKSFNVLVVKP